MGNARPVKGFRQVDPVEARMGVCLETYECDEAGFQGLKRGLVAADAARKRHEKKNSEIVYTKINRWGKGRNNDVWQIFMITKG